MYIIAGLGNPGKEYMGTRHNAGFSVIDELADKYNISVFSSLFIITFIEIILIQ